MSNVGRFVWREIMSTDVEKSVAFFTALFPWTVQEMDMGPGGKYRMFSTPNGKSQGGFVGIDAKQSPGVPSHMIASVATDVRGAAQRVKNNGGKLLVEPTEMPNDMGRYAVAQDPQGGVFGLYETADPGQRSAEPPHVGEFCWDQLNSPDIEASLRFYGEAMGWKTGDMGGIPLFTMGTKMEDAVASIVEAPKGAPAHWLSHVVVAKLGETRAKAVELGGNVLVESIPVPSIGLISVLQDPTGLVFCAFEPEMKR